MFYFQIMVNVPTLHQRKKIIEVHACKMPLGDDLDLDRVAELTNGYVGADLVAVCNEAAYAAMTESRSGKVRLSVKNDIYIFKMSTAG